MSTLKQPRAFEPGNNPAEAWEKWRQLIEIYWIAADLDKKPIKTQKATLLHILGEEGIALYNTFEFQIEPDAEANQDLDEVLNVETILDAFSEHYTPYKNETYIRHMFFTTDQKEGQAIDEYVTELRIKVRDCGFESLTDSLIRDRIVCGIRSNQLREKLLKTRDLNLATCVQICRAEEEASKQVNRMFKSTEVLAISNKNKKEYEKKQGTSNQEVTQSKQNRICSRCTFRHDFGKCPAFGQRCNKCNRPNHFAKACRSKYQVNQIEGSVEPRMEDENFTIGAIYKVDVNAIQKNLKEWTQEIRIQNSVVQLKLDTGSQANLLPFSLYKNMMKNNKLQKTNNKLVSYTGNEIELVGYCKLVCYVKGISKELPFYITRNETQPLLGLEGIQNLELLKRVENITSDDEEQKRCWRIIESYKDVFEGLGCANYEYTIKLREDAQPTIARCRRVPQALLSKVKNKLDEMEQEGILSKIDEPTDWTHPIVVVMKPGGDIRLCMDPRPLNKYIKRERLQLPTFDTTVASIGKAKYFSVLDASSAFHQIPLDKKSSKLCTITTPYGRYSYKRLPFGLSSSSEVFQKAINRVVEKVPGTVAYADDVLIFAESLKEHNNRLEELLRQARLNNIKFKKDKTQLGVTKIKYLGHWISQRGIEVCENKINAITDIEEPKSKKDLQIFLGMINYLSRFLPNLSKETAPLRNLLKNDTHWVWTRNEELCFKKLKQMVCNAPILALFDNEKEVVIATDASKEAVGSVLLQDNQPVAYSSASLTSAQIRYSVIEKELMAITTACEHYHYYVYGRQFVVRTDHKPLIGLVNKPIDDMSPRLQSLVLRLMKYDVKLEYHPGKTMYVPDALSRLPRSNRQPLKENLEEYKVQTIVVASKQRKEELKEETFNDSEMQQVIFYIRNGWPKKLGSISKEAKPYFPYRHELFENNGFLFKNKLLVIPRVLIKAMLERIHDSCHQGINSSIRRAQEALFWPNMTNDIKEYVSSCVTCQKYARNNIKEPITSMPLAEYPWERIAIDFMELKSEKFLLLTDYYSKYVIIQPMKTTVAQKVIEVLKTLFCMFGNPAQVICDNGPPFGSQEFIKFLKNEEIDQKTSSPYHPQSNGLIERHVQTIKNLIIKSPDEDPQKLVMIYNSTPKSDLPSPGEILFGRPIRTNLPIAQRKLMAPNEQKIANTLTKRQETQAKYYNQHTKTRQDLNTEVMIQKEKSWVPAEVIRKDDNPNSFWVKTEDGAVYRRNKIHLKNRTIRPRNEAYPKDDHIHIGMKECGLPRQTRFQVKYKPQQTNLETGPVINNELRPSLLREHLNEEVRRPTRGIHHDQQLSLKEDVPRRSVRLSKPPGKLRDYVVGAIET